MSDEKQKNGKETAATQQGKAQPTFMLRMGMEGYPLVDQVGKVVVIEREEKDLISLGFQDSNERKEIVLTATIEKWKKIFDDGLAYIASKSSTK